MSNNYITNTTRADLHMVAHQGVALCTCHKQIQDLLRNRLNEAMGQLFAEPIVNEGDNSIDWYTDLPGRALPVSALPEDEASRVRDLFAEKVAAIRKVGDELLATTEGSAAVKGHILQKALTWPDDNCLYACNGQPVLVCWGFSGKGLNTVRAENIDRTAMAKATATIAAPAAVTPEPEPVQAPPPPPPPPEEKKKGFGWWPLLLIIPLLLLLLWLLQRCSRPELPVSAPEPVVEKPATPTEPVQTVDHGKTDTLPVEDDGKGETLRIPEKVEDVSFMRGLVRVYTPLVNDAGQRVTVRAVLDAKGKGTAYIASGSQTCTGPALAEYEPGMVKVTTEVLQCPNGNNFAPIVMICKGQGELDCGLENNGKLLPVRAIKQDMQ